MVTSLTRSDGVYVATAGGEALEARQVVVATGPFQVPFIPPIAKELDPGVRQLHSVEYRNPATMPPGTVLVVGAATSGCQIARELSATHAVELSAGMAKQAGQTVQTTRRFEACDLPLVLDRPVIALSDEH